MLPSTAARPGPGRAWARAVRLRPVRCWANAGFMSCACCRNHTATTPCCRSAWQLAGAKPVAGIQRSSRAVCHTDCSVSRSKAGSSSGSGAGQGSGRGGQQVHELFVGAVHPGRVQRQRFGPGQRGDGGVAWCDGQTPRASPAGRAIAPAPGQAGRDAATAPSDHRGGALTPAGRARGRPAAGGRRRHGAAGRCASWRGPVSVLAAVLRRWWRQSSPAAPCL
jgi:hypothetical protein